MRIFSNPINEYVYIFLLTLIASICYFKLPSFDFQTGWDDHWVVINHYTEKGFTADNFMAILQDFYHGQYAPVNQLYYTCIYYLFGYNAGVFHLAGLIVHSLNVVVTFYFIAMLCRLAFRKSMIESQKIAFVSAVLFAVHPVNIEPTAWISASKILLYSFFYLLALLVYLKYLISKNTYVFYLCIILFVISFGAKEQAVSLPLCLLLLDYICGRNLKNQIIWYEKLPFLIFSTYFGIVSISSQETDGTHFYYTYAIFERFALAGYTVTEYLTKCIMPIKLSYLYPFPFDPNQRWPIWIWVYPFTILISLILVKKYLRKKWILFGFLFFFIHILIVLNLLNLNRYAVVADRYAYLSSIGICFLFGYGYNMLGSGSFGLKKIANYALGIVVAYFTLYAHFHADVWKNTQTLKSDFRTIISDRKDFLELKNKINSKDE